MFRLGCVFLMLCLSLRAVSAMAACSGDTVDREFRQADVVVRARLISQERVWSDEPSAAFRARWGDGGPVALYGLRVIEVFKGAPGSRINFFQELNSGRFVIDPDRDYLLYLNYIRPYAGRPIAARGATHVRFACGQSKPMAEVRREDFVRLRALARR